MQEEIWKDIKNFEGIYRLSNFGRIKSIDRHTPNKSGTKTFRAGLVRKCTLDNRGYPQIKLVNYTSGFKRATKVHILIAEHFIPNLNNLPQVNHKDGNKLNNHVDNLEWISNKNNYYHARNLGLYDKVNKKVLQYNLNHEFIKEWACTMDIERELKIPNTQISTVCRSEYGKRRAKEYYWKYK